PRTLATRLSPTPSLFRIPTDRASQPLRSCSCSRACGRPRKAGRRSSPTAHASSGVYEVCPVAARGAGRVVVDQVVRRDRLPGDPQEPVFPALGGLGWLVG